MNKIINFFKKFRNIFKNDPVKHCLLYIDEGCSHVDGPLCDFPDCSMLKRYKDVIQKVAEYY